MKRAVTVAAVAAAVLVAGCSSKDDGEKGGTGGGSAADATKAAVLAAQKYQNAVNDEDWATACGLRTERYRHGSVKECVANNEPKTTSPEPDADRQRGELPPRVRPDAPSSPASPRRAPGRRVARQQQP
ncbi:hypothetical protein SALBM311S_05307 [Streptomyces alboniger]